ncbi:MAG: MltA domain-containing protein [Alphaproteobacteria bacterium]|nr:MltA domain-containing protein [Alphaproteobacteria bacterium]MBN2779590.1 MltA domain-containing protein [Alphaproteobacteria bacterium]
MNHLIQRVFYTRLMRLSAIVIPLFLVACDFGGRMEDKVRLEVTSFEELQGWQQDDSRHALMSFARSCQKFISYDGCPKQDSAIYLDCEEMKNICLKMPASPDRVSKQKAKKFFEDYFTPYLVSDYQEGKVGMFTGYYQPAIKGSRTKTSYYSAPIYSPPCDLVSGQPYLTRAQIENQGLAGKSKVLYWTHPVDLFDLQTQGSGVLELPDGKSVEIGYAGNNGHTYQSVTIEMKKRGMKPAEGFTAQGVLKHLKKQPYQTMRSVLQTNPRYIFYKENGVGPIGSQGVVLTPQRSLAVDPSYIPLGVPLFLNTTAKGYAFRKLVMAQDTGSKILGAVRGDVYWGTGHTALEWAGKMKNDGTYYVLLPKNATVSNR